MRTPNLKPLGAVAGCAALIAACGASGGTASTSSPTVSGGSGGGTSVSAAPAPSAASRPASAAASTAAPSSNSTGTSATSSPSPANPRYNAPSSTERVTIASGLDHPWSLAFLPDGSLFVTQRANHQIIRVFPGTTQAAQPVITIDDVAPAYEGGMLGLTLSPSFATDGFVYLYYTAATEERVVRLHWDGNALTRERDILTGIGRSPNYHHGGRLAFGPDGKLYIATGDAKNGALAQDTSSLNGKILRLNPDGSVPADNPFGNAVWSYGHRNVEGLAWDSQGNLIASELGEKTYDELNLIQKGKNYGWPNVEGPGGQPSGYVDPIATWRPTSSCSPSGIAITGGTIYVACLAGTQLATVSWNGSTAGQPQTLLSDLGRVRSVTPGPDGRLWVTTDNGGSDEIVVLPGG